MQNRWMKLIGAAAVLLAATVATGQERISKNKLYLGSGTNSNKDIEFDIGLGANNPKLRVDIAGPTVQFSDDGTSFLDLSAGIVDASVSEPGKVNLIAQNFAGKKGFQDDIATDVIDEYTADTGVTIDGVLIKDGTGNFYVDGGAITGLHADTIVTLQRSSVAGANSFLSLISGTSGTSGIYFSPADDGVETGLFYDASTNVTTLKHNGSTRWQVLSGGQLQVAHSVRATTGADSDPSYGFSADTDNDTGFFRAAEDTIGISTDGSRRVTIDNTKVHILVQAQGADGSAGAPQYSYNTDTDTGWYLDSAGDNRLVSGGSIILGTQGGLLNLFGEQILGDATNDVRLRTRAGFLVNLERLNEGGTQRFGVTSESSEDLRWSVTDIGDMEYETGATQVLHKRTAGVFNYNFYGGLTIDINDDGSGPINGFRVEADGTTQLQAGGVEFIAGLRNDIGSSSDVCHSNSGGIGTYNECSSARRYKENFVEISEDEASLVYEAVGQNFDWISSGKKAMGFVANDMLPLFPRLVTWSSAKDDDGNPLVQGFDYKGYTAVLTKVIQMQKAEIDQLRADVDDLMIDSRESGGFGAFELQAM